MQSFSVREDCPSLNEAFSLYPYLMNGKLIHVHVLDEILSLINQLQIEIIL